MAYIRIHKDPLKLKPIVHVEEGNTNLLRWLSSSDYGYIGQHGAVVKLNGVEIADSTKMSPEEMVAATNINIGKLDSVDVFVRPQGYDPYTVWVALAVALVASAVAIALAPEPRLPSESGKRKSSPNNQLNAANNEFRPREAIPDISGKVRSYPDFIQPSYYEYNGDIKTITELFCIGRGYHLVENVRSSNTLIDDMTGSSYTVWQPNETVPDQRNVRSTNEVTGQEILYFEGGSSAYGATNVSNSTLDSTNQTVTLSNEEFRFARNFDDIGINDDITINVDYIPFGGGSLTSIVIQGTVQNVAFDGVDTWTIEVASASPSIPDSAVGGAYGTISYQSTGSSASKQFFILEGSNNTEVWFQVVAPQGLRSDTGSLLSVPIDLEVQEIDASGNNVGTPITRTHYLAGDSLNPLFRTYKVTGLTAGRYKAAITRRTIPSSDDNTVDVVNVEAIQAVEYYTPNFGDVTVMEVIRTASKQESTSRTSKINADVTRRLELFSVSGTFNDGTFTATRSFAQYVMYLLCKLGGIPVDQVDYEALFDIETSLSDDELGYFDFTFDDEDISLRDRVKTACNVARVKYYNVGNIWNFVREEARQTRSAAFTTRNLKGGQARQTLQSWRDGDYDSIELAYVDPDLNTDAYIRRRINPTTGAIEEGYGERTKEIELAGCRNVLQATNRADLEIRRMRYQRYSIRDTALSDALNVGVGERISWCDINDAEIQTGEIVGSDGGNVFYTSDKLAFESGATYTCFVTDEEGAVSNSVVIDPVSGNDYAFEAFAPLVVYTADGYQKQMGSLYVIVKDGTATPTDFILTKRGKPNERGEVEIEASIYDERMFEND